MLLLHKVLTTRQHYLIICYYHTIPIVPQTVLAVAVQLFKLNHIDNILILIQPQPYADMQSSIILMPSSLIRTYFSRSIQQFTQQHYSQSCSSITHAHTATSHLVTHKRHALIQAAADLHLRIYAAAFIQQHYSNLHCNITFSYTTTLHLFTQQYYVHKFTQQHHTYVHSSIHLIIKTHDSESRGQEEAATTE